MPTLALRIVLWTLLLPLTTAHAFVVGTYNIRYANTGDVERGDGWEQRAPVIAALVQFHQFDILGVQEALHHQLELLQKLLPEYAYTGHGREDGKERGEHAAIFFRKDRFRLLEGGDFWLSETPSVPSKGWDAALPRICTWGKMQAVGDDRTFFVFNVHFDHRGVQARLESARLLLEKIREIAADQPTLLTGDFNVDQNSQAYRTLASAGALTDAYEAASIRYALNGTANAFDPNGKTESRIDHVFLSKHFKPRRYGVLTDSYRAPTLRPGGETASGNFPQEVKFREFQARLPSDHFPVLVELGF